jgi:hypothetical protein
MEQKNNEQRNKANCYQEVRALFNVYWICLSGSYRRFVTLIRP